MWLPASSLCGRQLSSDARGRRCPRAVRSTAASPPGVVAGGGSTDASRRPGGISMGPLQIVLGTISVIFLIVSVVFAYQAVRAMVRIIRTGQPDSTCTRPVGPRLKTLVVESLGHTRMLKWSRSEERRVGKECR